MSNLQFDNLSFVRRKCIGKIQTAESVRLSVKNDIAEVLSVGIDSAVNNYEVTLGEVSFFGKTNIRFLYSDGTAILGTNYSADFTANIESDLLDGNSKLTFDVITVDTKVETNANTATLTILLEITAFAYVYESLPYLCGGEVFTKTENIEYLSMAGVDSYSLIIDEELISSRDISGILLAESNLCLDEYTFSDGILKLNGKATVKITYTSGNEIVSDLLPFDFERELSVENINKDSQLRLTLLPRVTKVRLNISDDQVNNTFSVEIGTTLIAESITVAVAEIVTDCYGKDADYRFDKRTVTTTLPCGSIQMLKQTVATLPFEQDKTLLSAVNTGAIVTQCTSLEQKAVVEGIIYATLLCNTESGITGTQMEIPFSHTLDVDYLMPQCQSFAKVSVQSLNVTAGNELTVQAELCITVESERDVQYQVIVSADEMPFDKSQLPAIEICLASKGETTWQLAKGLHMSESDLIAVNPEITSPLDKDARIVVYNKL